ncbi:hypothetical protein SK128_008575 [Halocaridina rubra]|uniref:Ig-like domain-containing protein n=1 Tax=Halocaridina rubra TaxID=373956 RepID=A0AAN8WX54_HALRR
MNKKEKTKLCTGWNNCDYSLKIHPVLLEDDASYHCQVSAADGIPGIRSPPARLTVYMPPEPPIVKPEVVKTTAGMTITLLCISRGGRPPPEIMWVDDATRETIRDGILFTTDKMSDGKRVTVTSRLSFTPKRFHHNSTMTCLTSHQALTSPFSNKVHLEVLFPPEVNLRPRFENLVEGDEASFYCTANANPTNISYRWFHNSRQLHNQSSRTLTLHNISRNFHQNVISCEVSNEVGTSKKNLNIQVVYGPMFRSPPEDVAAETGKRATLKCDVDSNPPPIINWYQLGSRKLLSTGKAFEVIVAPFTTGVYICVASVRGFPDLEGRIRVLVKGPPLIVSSSTQEGRMGDTVILECTTVSIPTPIRITWTYRGRQIDLNDPRYEVLEERQNDALKNLLVIHGADSQDFGPYNCSVVNEYGVARKLITLNREKTIPVFMVAGGCLALILIGVIVTSLVLCNKRHSTDKESPLPEKPPAGNMTSQAHMVNMYEAPSDTNLSNDVSLFTNQHLYHQLTATSDRDAHDLHSLSTDSPSKSVTGMEGNVDRVLTIMEHGDTKCRRGSLNGLCPNGNAMLRESASPNATPDFCTIRRGAKPQCPANSNGRAVHETNLGGIPIFHQNGTTSSSPLNVRHSTYSVSRAPNYGSPLPPPYTRSPKVGSPRGSSSPTGSGTPTLPSSGVHNVEGGSPEAKYIFSPEAMRKPGTLV